MERNVMEERPGKRRRADQRDSDIESDSGYHASHHSSSGEEEDHSETIMAMEESTPWTRQDIIPADYIEALE
eukprot:11895673-Heterocapsa_arctica.AAC.1